MQTDEEYATQFEPGGRYAEADYLARVRPLSEWSEELGPVLWWVFPLSEAPYCGTPNDAGHTVEMRHYDGGSGEIKTVSTSVGGWPGYHTHWSPLPSIIAPR